MKAPFRSSRVFQMLLLASCLLTTQIQAAIVITGTRVIYPADQREVTVKLNNESSAPLLVQSWIDEGDTKSTPDTSSAPFILTPPIARIDGNKGQALRVRYTAQKRLPQDKESLFWLNVLEVPASADDGQNKLKIAFRSRIKLFYRPENLVGSPSSAAQQLQWRAQRNATGWELEGSNSSPYYLTLSKVSVSSNGQSVSPELDLNSSMIAPGEQKRLPLKGLVDGFSSDGAQVIYSAINDYGGISEFKQLLKP